ncbi:MAG TPA: energy transducer TonB [Thermoanaerobaculia bacterium]
MFETVLPETYEARSKRVLYETLPLSIGLHAIGIGATFVIAIWNVVFPLQSPRLVRAYSLASIPDPPPPPPPLTPPAPVPKHVEIPKVPQPPLDQIVAPTVIPDTIPQLPEPMPPPVAPAPEPPAPVLGGSVDGELGGVMGGKLHGVSGGIAFPQDGRVHIERNQQLPLLPVSQDYPIYPDEARKKQLEDQVIVRYVIGKNGRVIDIQIIDHAKEPMFDQATVDAIRQWRFRPMIKDGKPVEVVHELAVNFELIRH